MSSEVQKQILLFLSLALLPNKAVFDLSKKLNPYCFFVIMSILYTLLVKVGRLKFLNLR